MGDLYHNANVVGLDLSLIQPRCYPPNFKFCIDVVRKDWVNGGNFDLIHARYILPFIRQGQGVVVVRTKSMPANSLSAFYTNFGHPKGTSN